MDTFKISEKIEVRCSVYSNHNSWGHTAKLYVNGELVTTSRVKYYNRTWEQYQFESILGTLCEKASKKKLLSKYHLAKFKKLIKDNWREDSSKELDRKFGMIAGIAKMGELLTNTKKEENAWKARMLKAGLGEGLDMPKGFDKLSETEKARRLDGVINILQK